MVSGLKFYQSDPQNKGRGRGHYYYRGALKQPNGRRVKTWSKYSEKRDAKQYHKRTKVRDVKRKEEKQPHKGDYKTKGKGRNKMTKRLSGSNIKGYF